MGNSEQRYVSLHIDTQDLLRCQLPITTIRDMTKKTMPVSIRLDPDVKAGLEALARADNRSLSSYVQLLLAKHVEAKSPKAAKPGKPKV